MSNIVKDYIKAQDSLKKYFGCQEDYLIKDLLDSNWQIRDYEGIFFSNYWNEYKQVTKAVIVKRDNEPLIYKTADYTMVIAIDCVKIAFILKKDKESN